MLFAFYHFPAEHWRQLCTINPIQTAFATVRHRGRQTEGCGSKAATLAMALGLAREAEKSRRKQSSCELISWAITGVRFENGLDAREAA